MTLRSFKGITFAMISSGTFGLIPLFSIPLMNDGMNTPSILFYRFLFSTILMGVICLFRKENLKIPGKHILTIFRLSFLYAATALLLMYSYNYIPSGIATTVHFLYPILVSIIMVLFFKEKKSIIIFLAAILSLIGVFLLCWTDVEHIKAIGIFIVSGTVITYAFYIVGINQSEAGKIKTEVLTFYILMFGGFIFFLFTFFANGIESIPNIQSWGRLLALALFATVISDLTLILAIKHVGSTITSILGSMEPLVAVSVGVLCFSEHFSLVSLLGISLIITSVTMVVLKSANKSSAPSSS